MRLATFNVLHGRSASDGVVDVARLRGAVTALDADVLGLQEVDRAQPRSSGHDLAAVAAAAMGGTGRFAPALTGTPGERWRPVRDGDGVGGRGAPAYGIALITRFPVRRWAAFRLPSLPVRVPVRRPGPARGVAWLRDEARVLLVAVVDTPAGRLTVATTHLSFVPGWNAAQLWRVVEVLRGFPGPRVLLGDLNLPGPLPGRLTGWRGLAREATYPADRPWVQLDHVLVSGDGLPAVRAARATRMPVSDHRALVVDLR
jgi:endonuclease/exonuclease/phosphatase family metal-dependent hydrolase